MPEKLLEPARHEPTDVGERFLWSGTVLLVVSVVFLSFVVVLLFPHSLTDWNLGGPLAKYPAPRQQTNPRADMEKFYAEEMERLNNVGWVDKADGIVHIPIEEAMRIIAKENIPDWPTAPGKAPVGQAEHGQPPTPMEKAHEAAPPPYASSAAPPELDRAAPWVCGPGTKFQRHCLRPEARKSTAGRSHVRRRHGPRGATR